MGQNGLISVIAIVCLSATMTLGDERVDLPENKLNAAKLAGLVGFVNIYCEKLSTNGERFKNVVKAMDVDPEELERDALLARAQSYIVAYQKDVPASCTRADELFGRAGRIIPGVFVQR